MEFQPSAVNAPPDEDTVEAPRAATPEAGREEWLIDESIEETFPASDPTTPVVPGSLAEQHVARAKSSRRARRIALYAGAAASAVVAGFLILKRFRRRA